MVDANSLIEGHCKFRDGRKWKSRWAVVTKLSPVADCLQLQVYRDEKERARNGHTKASLSLQDFLAMESGFTLDKESHTLAIICQELSVVLAFDNRERLIQWSVRIANNLGEGQHFLLQLASAPAKSKLTPGPVKLHVIDKKFCLTGGIPPRLLGHWEVPHLRRYGIVDGRIVFEGGSRCGKGEGVHVLVPDPPQMQLIIDALDMSSKGQLALARDRPSRRFGNGVTDSPRKSMSSRLSEMRTLSAMPAESSANISVMNVNVSANCNSSSSIPSAPRESWSAEALCSACGEISGSQSQMWMSSLNDDNCDSISVVAMEEVSIPQMRNAPHSPARNPSAHPQPLQIAKPLPSAMERCLSCMSKLGQQGQTDILSPSWTMDLNVHSAASVATANMAANMPTGPQGSIGSGNSDRLSISSHGSGSGCGVIGGSGGVGPEYYYDTPRSVLVAEMRRNARSNTPPGMFHGSSQLSNSCGGGQQGMMTSGGGCASPCRGPRSHISIAPAVCPNSNPNQSHNGAAAVCGLGNCHCQSQPRANGQQQSTNGHIYYNGAAEHKSHGGNKAPQPINLHAGGPYENYDFPRCAPAAPANPSGGSGSCYPYSLNGDGTLGLNAPSSMSSIDWNKKFPMDRSSVATTASTSISLVGSSSEHEFYDTPQHRHCPCCTPNPSQNLPTPGCPCCSQTPAPAVHHTSGNNGHHLHSHQHSHYQSHHQQNPSCVMRPRADPLENYDVPPHNNPHNLGLSSSNTNQQIMQHSMTSTSISINGEGKMPLVAGNIPTRPNPNNPNAIYAQVDKSKKTPRVVPLPTNQHQHQFINCDNLPIYENRNAVHQPTYINLDGSPCGNKIPKPPAPDPTSRNPPAQEFGHSNYVNLQFAESLQLYENAKELSSELPPLAKEQTQVLVHPEPKTFESEVLVDATNQMKSQDECKMKESEKSDQERSTSSSNKTDSGVEKDKFSAIPSTSASSASTSAEDSRRGSHESNEAVSLPLRRSSSVPCKGGHANRGSASSSDSGVSGDGGLFFEDSSPLNDIGRCVIKGLCLHESLPRKSQRISPSGSNGKNTSATTTPRPQEAVEDSPLPASPTSPNVDTTLANRHYETIEEVESNTNLRKTEVISGKSNGCSAMLSKPNPVNPLVAAVKCAETVQIKRNLVSDANSTSSGNSDMSDYIESLSTGSRSSGGETVTTLVMSNNAPLNISASPKRSTSMKPRSGKEYLKIDRTLFKNQ